MDRFRCPSRILLVLWLTLIALPAHGLPEGQWYEARTEHATVYANVGRAELARFVDRAHWLRAALRSPVSREPFLDRPPTPTHVYIFADADAYRPYQHREGGGPAFVDGTHFGRPHAGYVTLNGASPRADRALVHELVHRSLPHGIPRWAEEGLAEVYASVAPVDGRLLVGAPDPVHAEALAGDWLPLSELLTVDDLGAPRYRVGRARTLFYAQSWLLVHYLWSDPTRRNEWLTMLRAGRPPTLPNPDALRRHLDAGPRPIDLGPVPPPPPTPAPPTKPRGDAMRYADVLFRLGDLLMIQGGRDAEAAEHFRTALGIDSGHGAALGGLALLAERVGDHATARERFERAVDLDPEDALLRFRYGRSLLEPAESGRLGDRFEAGSDQLRAALDQSRQARWLRDAIGWVYLQRVGPLVDAGRLDDARIVLDAYHAMVPPPERPPLARALGARLDSVVAGPAETT